MARRPLTDRQREIGSARRAHKAMQIDITEQRSIREQQHHQERVSTESDLAGGRRNRQITGAVVGKAASTANPSGDHGLIMTTIFLIAGLILFYRLVTTASSFGTLTTTVTNFLHSLSSTTPLFTTVSTTSTIPGGPAGVATLPKGQ